MNALESMVLVVSWLYPISRIILIKEKQMQLLNN
jgi:hypothetical protein